jgi:Flp pilus assembly protein TadD
VQQAEIERVRSKTAGKFEAYDLLLQALALRQISGRNEVNEAVRLLRQAVELDPTYPRAFANLSWCSWLAEEWRPARQLGQRPEMRRQDP